MRCWQVPSGLANDSITDAQGGYVVICNVGQTARIASLDDANESMRGRYDEYTLPLRLCLERLTGLRNKIIAGDCNLSLDK